MKIIEFTFNSKSDSVEFCTDTVNYSFDVKEIIQCTRRKTFAIPVYDAGTEINDELVSHIPGPGGEGYNPEDGEGFVHIHAGIHGIGDLPTPEEFDWRNPAARITSRITSCDVEYRYSLFNEAVELHCYRKAGLANLHLSLVLAFHGEMPVQIHSSFL